MPAGVQTTFGGDAQDVERALLKMEQKLFRLEGKLRDVERAGGRSGRKTSDAWGVALRQMKALSGAIIGAGGLLAAWRLVNAEIEKHLKLQKDAETAQAPVSSARADLIRNLFGQDQATISQALKAGRQISKDTGTSEKFIMSALASAVSASGQDVPASVEAVRTSAKFLPDKGEEVVKFAGSLLDLSKVSGTREGLVNLGLLATAGARSRVTEPTQQARNIPRALIGQKGFGAAPGTAIATFGALSEGGGDFMGALSANAAIGLSKQLEEAQFGRGVFKGKRIRFGEGVDTQLERIEFLQQNRKLAERFLDRSSFEKAMVVPIRDLLLNPLSDTAKAFRANLDVDLSPDALREKAGMAFMNLGLDPLFKGQQIKRAFTNAREQQLLDRILDAEGNINREGLIGVLDATGVGALEGALIRTQFEAQSRLGTRDPTQASINILKERAAFLDAPFRVGAGRMTIGERFPREPTEEETKAAGDLRFLMDTLIRIQEEQNRLLGLIATGNQKPALEAPNMDNPPNG